ncbi:hypothetical protein BDZ45DRAFT_370467 [Acephala macrosclerotiorum]|nr:hypothetical protein BDZ45DRAFT_370467 [Acephala macrosclerotiorum]
MFKVPTDNDTVQTGNNTDLNKAMGHRAVTMLRVRRWDTLSRDRMGHKEVTDPKEDIIMEGMHLGMDRRDSIWMIGGVGVRGLWRLCWLVWRVVVVWMLVCCSRCSRLWGLGGEWVKQGGKDIKWRGQLERAEEGKRNCWEEIQHHISRVKDDGRGCTYRLDSEQLGVPARWLAGWLDRHGTALGMSIGLLYELVMHTYFSCTA